MKSTDLKLRMIYLVLMVCRKLCQYDKISILGFPAGCYLTFKKHCSWSSLFRLGCSLCTQSRRFHYSTLLFYQLHDYMGTTLYQFSIRKPNTFKWKFNCTFHLYDWPLCGRRGYLNGSSRKTENLGKFLIGITMILHFLTKNSYYSNNHNILRKGSLCKATETFMQSYMRQKCTGTTVQMLLDLEQSPLRKHFILFC